VSVNRLITQSHKALRASAVPVVGVRCLFYRILSVGEFYEKHDYYK